MSNETTAPAATARADSPALTGYALPDSETLQQWADKADAELAAGWRCPHNDYGRELRTMQVRQWRAIISERKAHTEKGQR